MEKIIKSSKKATKVSKTSKTTKKGLLKVGKKKESLSILKRDKKDNGNSFKIAFYIIFIIIVLLILYFVNFKKPKTTSTNDDTVVKEMLGVNNIDLANANETMSMVAIPDTFKVYSASSDTDSGPANIMNILSYYGNVGVFTEDIVKNMKSGHGPFHQGTCVNQMKEILSTLNIKYYDNSNYKNIKELANDSIGLKLIEDSVKAKYPILVGWNKKPAYWSLVIGYDNKGTDDNKDDVLLMADVDDGDIKSINANEFAEKWDFGDFFKAEPLANDKAKNCFVIIDKSKK